MPFYDYRCDKCDHIWEVQHMMDENPKLVCPECRGRKATKQIPMLGATYIKGNGFLDVEGRRRDMHLYKLQNEDPYKDFRPEGDKEVIERKLKNAGKFGYDKNGNKKETRFYRDSKAKKVKKSKKTKKNKKN